MRTGKGSYGAMNDFGTIGCLTASLVVALLLTGCVSLGNGKLRDDTVVAQIKVGMTTKNEVQAALGDPIERRSTPLGPVTYEWWGYSYSTSVINPLEYLFLIGLFVNGIGTPDTRRDVQVFFDPDGTVRSVRDQTTRYDLGVLRADRVVSSIKTETALSAQRTRAIRYEERVGNSQR
jgi:hypothetical protein